MMRLGAIVVLAGLPLIAGCLDSSDVQSVHEFRAVYQNPNGHQVTWTLDGPVEVRDHDDVLRAAYRFTMTDELRSSSPDVMYFDGNMQVGRDDGCSEYNATTCFQRNISWYMRGMASNDGVGWPQVWERDGAIATYGSPLISRVAIRGGVEFVKTWESHATTYRFKTGETVPYEWSYDNAAPTRRIEYGEGPALSTITAWPPAPEPVVGPSPLLFPGDDTDAWGWGHTHREAYDVVLRDEPNAVAALDGGCLFLYQAGRKSGSDSSPPFSLIYPAHVASHTFYIINSGGVLNDWTVDAERDGLGEMTLKSRAGGGTTSFSYSPQCPVRGETRAMTTSLGEFLGRLEMYRQLIGGRDDLEVWYETKGDSAGTAYSVQSWFQENVPIESATMAADGGTWLSMRLRDDAPADILDRPTAS